MRIELTTSTLARWRSTAELYPQMSPASGAADGCCSSASAWIEGLIVNLPALKDGASFPLRAGIEPSRSGESIFVTRPQPESRP